MRRNIALLVSMVLLHGCSLNAYHNRALPDHQGNAGQKTSHHVSNREGSSANTLVLLALSGGGSRAAYFSSLVMFRLEELGLLREVDMISSVSGGSLPAAYYALSKDAGQAAAGDLVWKEEVVKEAMARNYTLRWFGNWFWPTNIARYWFTSFNRSHIMAQTLADNLFDHPITGVDYRMKDLRLERPNLILNATNGTTGQFSQLFTFTNEDFDDLHTDLGEFDIGMAVMASASFPSVFNYINLRDYSRDDRYFHVFDGGNSDNLGLKIVHWALDWSGEKFDRIVLILVDVFNPGNGVSPLLADGRKPLDYVIDSNFLDSFDCLLERNREVLVEDMINRFSTIRESTKKPAVFYHLKFDNLAGFGAKLPEGQELLDKTNAIATDFKISDDGQRALEKVASSLVVANNPCIALIKRVVAGETAAEGNSYCTWPAIPSDYARMASAAARRK